MQRSLTRRQFLLGVAGLTAGTMGLATLPGTTPSASAAPLLAEPAQVQFWDMVWGPPEYVDTGKKLVDQFNQEHPDIQVTYQSTPWNNWYQTFVTAIGAGTAPDISTGAAFQAAYFYSQGAILEIDDVVKDLQDSGTASDFVAGSLDALRQNGHYIAVPWAIDIRIPSYRKDLFDKAGVQPPTNWDELKAAMQKLTSGQQYGMVSAGDTLGTQHLWLFMLNNDGGLFTEDKKANLLSDRNMEALEYFSSLVKAGYVAPASAGYTGDDAVKIFGQGNAAILIHNPALYSRFPDLPIGVLPPFESPHGTRGTVYWINNIMVYKQTRNPEATKTFLKWWLDNMKLLWTEGHNGQLVVRQSFMSDPYFQKDETLKYVFENWVPVGKTLYYHSPELFPQLNTIEGEGWAQTMVQELLQGKDARETATKANEHLKILMGE